MIRPPMPLPIQVPMPANGGAAPKQQMTPFSDLLGGVGPQAPAPPANATESECNDTTVEFGTSVTLALESPESRIDDVATAPVPTLELYIADQGEVVRIVGVPWQLAPSGDFSQLLRGDVVSTQTAGFAPGSAPMSLPSHQASLAMQEVASSETMPIGVDSGRAGARGIPSARTAIDPVDPRAEMKEASSASLPPDAAASQPWLARVCRWILQHGGEPAVFLRDYRLDERTAMALAEALHEQARTQGLTLRRIVCNGRELWRAPDHRFPTGES